MQGRQFTKFTDHKLLGSALDSNTHRSPRQTRHLEYIAQFTNDIQLIKGDSNVVAGTLSAVFEVESLGHAYLSFRTLYEEQQRHPDFKQPIGEDLNLKHINVPSLKYEV